MMRRLSDIPLAVRAAVVALALSGVLFWMIWDRAQLLRTGREIVLKTRPIDPRDIFRGHYARLEYDISRIPNERIAGLRDSRVKRGRVIHVILRPPAAAGDGFWTLAGASLSWPREVPPGGVVMRGRVVYAYSGEVRARYGIERYYASKKRALEVERLGRRPAPPEDLRPLGVIVRVSPSGKAAIAGLMIDGRKVYEEPIW